VPHAHTSGKLVGTDRTLQGLPNNSTVKLYTGKKLGVVVRMLLDQSLPPVVKEVGERGVSVSTQSYLIILTPDYYSDQGYVDVQGSVQSVGNIRHILALPIHLVQILPILFKLPVVHDNDKFNKP
jgi:hypothetical protein